jgi:hypothetical protein
MWDDDTERRAREAQRARDLQRQKDSQFASQSEGTGGGGCPLLILLAILLTIFIGVVML